MGEDASAAFWDRLLVVGGCVFEITIGGGGDSDEVVLLGGMYGGGGWGGEGLLLEAADDGGGGVAIAVGVLQIGEPGAEVRAEGGAQAGRVVERRSF